MSNSKKYESGICKHCGKKRSAHLPTSLVKHWDCPTYNEGGTTHFKDSGLAALKAGALGLYQAAEAVIDTMQYSDDSHLNALAALREAVESCKVEQKSKTD